MSLGILDLRDLNSIGRRPVRFLIELMEHVVVPIRLILVEDSIGHSLVKLINKSYAAIVSMSRIDSFDPDPDQ